MTWLMKSKILKLFSSSHLFRHLNPIQSKISPQNQLLESNICSVKLQNYHKTREEEPKSNTFNVLVCNYDVFFMHRPIQAYYQRLVSANDF